jgi:hypothetical protein
MAIILIILKPFMLIILVQIARNLGSESGLPFPTFGNWEDGRTTVNQTGNQQNYDQMDRNGGGPQATYQVQQSYQQQQQQQPTQQIYQKPPTTD